MNRCDECKHKDNCVCIPYGCECFELDLEEHDKQIRADVINKFVKAYTKFMDEDEKCNIYEECYDSPTGYCIDCFKEKWLKEQKNE